MTATRGTSTGIGADVGRLEGTDKVTGRAVYAAEHALPELAYCWPVQSRIVRGRVTSVGADAVLALPGVLAVLSHENAPELAPQDDTELAVLQSDAVAYRGQVVAAVVASTLEIAREAAGALEVGYDEQPHDAVLSPGSPRVYEPAKVNPAFPAATEKGDFEGAFASSPVQVDRTYTTPAEHNNPMEPHATVAVWDGDRLTLFDATQGAYSAQQTMAKLFRLAPEQVRVQAEHVGGGFGAKGTPRPNAVLAAMAARMLQRPVKCVLTRAHQFALVGYRTPTIQRVRLGAEADGTLLAIGHDAAEQTSTVYEFAEQTALVSRVMYAAPHRHTAHTLAALDVPTPRWMRAPGECPGMFALESAMDELAVELGLDPVELRIRNEPAVEPESGKPWSSRNLVACLREGARRFGWADRDPAPGVRRDGRWLVGTGVASSTYPAYTAPSTARAKAEPDGRFRVSIAAADIGTGARTVIGQLAAEALGVPIDEVTVHIGDSSIGQASLAGGSMGTSSWGWAVTKACRELRGRLDDGEAAPLEVVADTAEDLKKRGDYARQAFGAQFAEVRVDADSGEVRVPRLLGVFAAGRIMNPRTARSQFIGGMTMGLSMALHEEGVMDPAFGAYMNHDFAGYHIATAADVGDIEVGWVDEVDDELNPMGAKGIGEIGIVGTAAAVANALWHATGLRLRDLPLRPDRVLDGLPA